MAVFINAVTEVEKSAAKRYEQRKRAREERKHNLNQLGIGGDWRKIDEPNRILTRLVKLGMADVASEAMASTEVAELKGIEVPSIDVMERIIGADDSQGVRFLYDGACAARSVGRIIIRSAGGNVLGYGTGFMISPQLLMTNNHVLGSKADASLSSVQWDYYENRTGSMSNAVEVPLSPNEFFITSKDLDFTIVAINIPQGKTSSGRGWLPLDGTSGKAIVGELVNVIQHPNGGPQKIALRANRIVDVFDLFLHYETDTNPGASGSPVLNDQWELAALHHAGVPKTTNGTTTWVANEGIRISRIVEFLKLPQNQSDFNALQKKLLEQLLSGKKPDDCSCHGATKEINPTETKPSHQNSISDLQPAVDENGNATWVLPLRVTIGIGNSLLPSIQKNDSNSKKNNVIFDAPKTTPDNFSIASNADWLKKSLDQLRRHEGSEYYNKNADVHNRNSYYSDIDFDNLSPKNLYKALSKLLQDTHETLLGYDVARLEHLYPWVDLQESQKLFSVYSNKPFDAEEIIRLECELQARRENQLREFMRKESSISPEAVENFLDQLEASEPYNCEHVVPQSWFNKKNPMRGDLHHLFTCESNCNSFRGNIPYYQFEHEVVRQDCGRRENGKFEPTANKGAVARATLYFLLRYPGIIGDAGELKAERISILLDWHQEFSPNKWEKHRNAEIFALQGNRNPLIDHPDIASKVDFSLGFVG